MWMIVVMSLLGWPLRSWSAGFRVPAIENAIRANLHAKRNIFIYKLPHLRRFLSRPPSRGGACSR